MSDSVTPSRKDEFSWLLPRDAARLRAVTNFEQAEMLWQQEKATVSRKLVRAVKAHPMIEYDEPSHTNLEWLKAIYMVRKEFSENINLPARWLIVAKVFLLRQVRSAALLLGFENKYKMSLSF